MKTTSSSVIGAERGVFIIIVTIIAGFACIIPLIGPCLFAFAMGVYVWPEQFQKKRHHLTSMFTGNFLFFFIMGGAIDYVAVLEDTKFFILTLTIGFLATSLVSAISFLIGSRLSEKNKGTFTLNETACS